MTKRHQALEKHASTLQRRVVCRVVAVGLLFRVKRELLHALYMSSGQVQLDTKQASVRGDSYLQKPQPVQHLNYT